jgi:hypothetical protein
LGAFEFGFGAGEDLGHQGFDAFGGWRAAGEEIVYMDHLVQRQDLGQQSRDDAGFTGDAGVGLGALDVSALENAFAAGKAELIANRRDVCSYRAIAEGDEDFRSFANQMEEFEVVLVANGAFDQANVDVFRVFLHVDNGAIDDIDFAGEFDEELVEVEE